MADPAAAGVRAAAGVGGAVAARSGAARRARDDRPGTVEEVHDALVARRIVVDHRPGAGIRVGPHFFTTAEEIDLVVDAIAEARAALG